MSPLFHASVADAGLAADAVELQPSLPRAILFGGLIAGALDISDAFAANWILSPTPNPVRLLQGIASGLLGPASFDGGLATAALGLLCHFTIALGAATVYVLASRRLPVLVRHPVICGLAFGIAVHLFMQHVVLPLSAIRMRTTPLPWPQLANQYLIHALGVGLPIALAARRWAALPSSPPDASPRTTTMKSFSICLLSAVLVFGATSSSQAQPAANPYTAMLTSSWNDLKKLLSASAELLPEADYGFKPSPDVRSFGQLIGHLANDHYLMCSGAKGEKSPSSADHEKTTGKADLVAALNKSIAYCDSVFASMNDRVGVEPVEMFRQKYIRLGALNLNIDHSSQHYGNLVTYLRMKGRVPPSSTGQ